MSETALHVGDRVLVTDQGLAQLRAIMRRATGQEPPPNHHGVIIELWDDGDALIEFDDGAAAPYPLTQICHLSSPDNQEKP